MNHTEDKELEEAATKYHRSIMFKSDMSGSPYEVFKAGASWQKEQMKKRIEELESRIEDLKSQLSDAIDHIQDMNERE